MLVNIALLRELSEYEEDDRPIYGPMTYKETFWFDFWDSFILRKSIQTTIELPEYIAGKTMRVVRAERLKLPSALLEDTNARNPNEV